MHLYIWPRNSFSSHASRAPNSCTSLLILARELHWWRFRKESNKRRRPNIYICVFSYQSSLQPRNYVLSTDKHTSHLFKFDSFGTRDQYILRIYVPLFIILRYRWIVVVIVVSRDYDIAVTIVTILPKSL